MEYLASFPVGYETFVSDVLFTEQNVLEMVPCPYVKGDLVSCNQRKALSGWALLNGPCWWTSIPILSY